MARAKVVLPPMQACPRCTLLLEVGTGPGGVAHHQCKKPKAPEPRSPFEVAARELLKQGSPITDEQMLDMSRRAVLAYALEAKDPAALMELVRMAGTSAPKRGGPRTDGGLAAFLAGAPVAQDDEP